MTHLSTQNPYTPLSLHLILRHWVTNPLMHTTLSHASETTLPSLIHFQKISKATPSFSPSFHTKTTTSNILPKNFNFSQDPSCHYLSQAPYHNTTNIQRFLPTYLVLSITSEALPISLSQTLTCHYTTTTPISLSSNQWGNMQDKLGQILC
jgi:hypothetical protein